jgi:hypothetical protein
MKDSCQKLQRELAGGIHIFRRSTLGTEVKAISLVGGAWAYKEQIF